MVKTKGFVVIHTSAEVQITAHLSCVILSKSLIFWMSLFSSVKQKKKVFPHNAFERLNPMKYTQNT